MKTNKMLNAIVWGAVIVSLALVIVLAIGGGESDGTISADIAPFNHNAALSEAMAYIYVYHDLPISKPTSNPGDWEEQTISSSEIRFTQDGWTADVDEKSDAGAYDFIITYDSTSYSMEWVGYRSISSEIGVAHIDVTTWTGIPPPTSVQPTTTGTYIPSYIYETSFTETYHNGATTTSTNDGTTPTDDVFDATSIIIILLIATIFIGGYAILTRWKRK